MPEIKPELDHGEVLALSEAAAFPRVSEDQLLRQVSSLDIPARKIDDDWRFSRKALSDWLRHGVYYKKFKGYPYPHPGIMEEVLMLLEDRIIDRLIKSNPPPVEKKTGLSQKERLMKFAGKWKDDPETAEVHDSIERARQESMEGEE